MRNKDRQWQNQTREEKSLVILIIKEAGIKLQGMELQIGLSTGSKQKTHETEPPSKKDKVL
jgi:hypothetical protein